MGLGVTAPDDIKTNRINTSHIPDEYQVNSRKETAVGAGVGVGVSLGVIALALLGWALWLLRQNRNLKKTKAQNPEQGKDQFQGQMGYEGQSGIMMPSGGQMSPESPTYGRDSYRVEQMEMHENPSELPGMPKRGP
ncbi:uncharacterized protein KD926_008428 [Aspergillus affinis]|uniref:uncharacterized protein n=1 Tax=Aspergillus affinis TaxID=1070780 RepID=UPI0022FF1DE6|nr:uncharacterized protein KD926_008428 [Aspergillus affinis]KAI9040227.1 hypothetical protein KD926_008428 [Aspergillus affinis]